MRKLRLKYTLLLILLTIFGLTKSFACSCIEQLPVAESIQISDIVFSGQVISKVITSNLSNFGYKYMGDTAKVWEEWKETYTAVVKIKVDRNYTEHYTSDTLIILTPPDGGACGVDFQIGERYIIYATIEDEYLDFFGLKRVFDNKTFWTHLCTRTQEWNTTEENQIIREIKMNKD